MTGLPLLDWAILAVSLLNAILLLWLGLTVLLNAGRRTWGIWLTGCGLFLGSLFFISHTAILGYGLRIQGPGLNFWWHVGWIPAAALPMTWYIVMLWYIGFWDRHAQHPAWLRQRAGLGLAALLFLVQCGLILLANPLPSLEQLASRSLEETLSLGGVPVLVLVYPLYALLCFALPMHALTHPAPSGRWMGDLARARARPWFLAASLALLGVSGLVGWAMLWIIRGVPGGALTTVLPVEVGWFDIVIECCIALAVLLIGQAVISYEVFTGMSLPRQGLSLYWRRAVILACGYSLLVAGSIVIQLRPVYSLLLTAVLMTVFFALLGWRAYSERERLFKNLRPFVTSQRLYENLLDRGPLPAGAAGQPGASPAAELARPFYALCQNVLETRQACLGALGMLAPLSGPPVVYPQGTRFDPRALEEAAAQIHDQHELAIPLDPARCGGMILAVPLWSERGPAGVLLLGEKRSGGLYTVEEVEIARAAGERLIDTRASAEMARRLMALQRQRLAESQVLDRRARHTLHDDILPLLHAAMLQLAAGDPDPARSPALPLLADIHRQLSDLLRSIPGQRLPEVSRAGLVGALRQTAGGELDGAFDRVEWEIQPEAEQAAFAMPAFVSEVLYSAAREALRNAARHGRKSSRQYAIPRPLCVTVTFQRVANNPPLLRLSVQDTGAGFHSAAPDTVGTDAADGPSTGEESADGPSEDGQPIIVPTSDTSPNTRQQEPGAGQGLALHSTMMAVIGGTLKVDSSPGQYTRVQLDLPFLAWENE